MVPRQTPRGHATKQGILEVATAIASVEGLEGLTLGRLATHLSMSKSGLFAHFGSKEDLQLATIEHARQVYVAQVILPGLAHSPGIATLHGLCESYVALMEQRVFPGGCFFAAAMAEFDARPGVVRDTIAALQRQWLDMLEGAAGDGVGAGELDGSVDPVQLAFELEAAMLSANWYFHLYNDARFFALSRSAIRRTISAAASPKGQQILEEVLCKTVLRRGTRHEKRRDGSPRDTPLRSTAFRSANAATRQAVAEDLSNGIGHRA